VIKTIEKTPSAFWQLAVFSHFMRSAVRGSCPRFGLRRQSRCRKKLRKAAAY